jgi:hypothetical protein
MRQPTLASILAGAQEPEAQGTDGRRQSAGQPTPAPFPAGAVPRWDGKPGSTCHPRSHSFHFAGSESLQLYFHIALLILPAITKP